MLFDFLTVQRYTNLDSRYNSGTQAVQAVQAWGRICRESDARGRCGHNGLLYKHAFKNI